MTQVRRALPPTVVALGVVSLLTDVSSEMIYPLLPVFLTTVLGAGPQALGVIEGIAESTASLLKIVAGALSDRTRRRKPLILAGYTISGAVRPLIGLAASWHAVLGLRFLDRFGKGVRTAPRDALIADVTPEESRGRAYGFHRASDHAGAVLGPLVAALLLGAAALPMRTVFLLSAVPAVLVVIVLVGWVPEHRNPDPPRRTTLVASWRAAGKPFRLYLAALFLFTLGNSTDAFLLLKLSGAGVSVAGVALVWSLFHVVKMVTTYAGGRLSDRLGRKPMVLAGWLVYAAVYFTFAFVESESAVIATFFVYGVYYGLTEPVERAWVVDLVPGNVRGAAFGTYHGAIGLGALPASIVFGTLWQAFGARTAFVTGAVFAAAAALLLLAVPGRRVGGEREISPAAAPDGE